MLEKQCFFSFGRVVFLPALFARDSRKVTSIEFLSRIEPPKLSCMLVAVKVRSFAMLDELESGELLLALTTPLMEVRNGRPL